jgi:hypothetical protein
MLRGNVANRRSGERGQAFLLALALLAFILLFLWAILRFGGVAGLQHIDTEATATTDSQAEGGAAYAAADANRTDLAPVDCVPSKTGTLTMADSANTVVQYTIRNCNPGNSVPGFNGGTPCVLCVLNQVAGTPQPVLNYGNGGKTLYANGDIDVNGNIGGAGQVCTVASPGSTTCLANAPPFINLTGSCSNCLTTPNNYTTPISDPLRIGQPGGQQIPTPPATGLCSLAAPCTSTGGTLLIGPSGVALYSGINTNATFGPGVYILIGPSGGNHTWVDTTGHGVTIYLACATAAGVYDGACATPSKGGSIAFSGGGNATLTAPTAGLYSGVSLFADWRHTGTLLGNVGNGASSLTGTIDFPSGNWSDIGGGSSGISVAGRLIANSVTNGTDSGHPLSGLQLTGAGVPGFGGCSVFDDDVYALPRPATVPRAIVEQQCSGGSVSSGGTVDFNYLP